MQTEAEKENIHIPDVSEENIATQEELSSEMDQEEREDFDTLMSRGNGYLSEGYLSLAIKDFERASEIKPTQKKPFKNLSPQKWHFEIMMLPKNRQKSTSSILR